MIGTPSFFVEGYLLPNQYDIDDIKHFSEVFTKKEETIGKSSFTGFSSLGPIDAHIKIGRSIVSAHDYKVWVDLKKEVVVLSGSLNHFDAVMVAQMENCMVLFINLLVFNTSNRTSIYL